MEDCSICLEKLTNECLCNGYSEVILDCSHKYHLKCIHLNIIKGIAPTKCPLCRIKIDPKKILFKLQNNEKEAIKKKKIILDKLNNKLFINICGRHINIIPFENNSERITNFWLNFDQFANDIWGTL